MSETKGSGFELVVVGASAGGVQGLQVVLGSLPEDFSPAMLVILHLPPDRPSALAPLLSAQCRLPVTEVLDKQPIRPGNVALAPAGYHVLVEPDRTLALSIDEPVLFSRPALDPSFETAASVYRARLLAIVLTGASSDGSAGALAVRRQGGTVWVEDPASAHSATMPGSVLRTAGADAVLDLAGIGRGLAAMNGH